METNNEPPRSVGNIRRPNEREIYLRYDKYATSPTDSQPEILAYFSDVSGRPIASTSVPGCVALVLQSISEPDTTNLMILTSVSDGAFLILTRQFYFASWADPLAARLTLI